MSLKGQGEGVGVVLILSALWLLQVWDDDAGHLPVWGDDGTRPSLPWQHAALLPPTQPLRVYSYPHRPYRGYSQLHRIQPQLFQWCPGYCPHHCGLGISSALTIPPLIPHTSGLPCFVLSSSCCTSPLFPPCLPAWGFLPLSLSVCLSVSATFTVCQLSVIFRTTTQGDGGITLSGLCKLWDCYYQGPVQLKKSSKVNVQVQNILQVAKVTVKLCILCEYLSGYHLNHWSFCSQSCCLSNAPSWGSYVNIGLLS